MTRQNYSAQLQLHILTCAGGASATQLPLYGGNAPELVCHYAPASERARYVFQCGFDRKIHGICMLITLCKAQTKRYINWHIL